MVRESEYRILIVEDDQIFRELLVVALTLRGYTVYVAEGGQRAMSVIKNARPHLVTIDLRMPRTDGLRFLEWLRATRRFGSVPAIVVTAVDDKGTAVDALVSGASDVLTKPVDLEVLAGRIESLLAGRDPDEVDVRGSPAEEEGAVEQPTESATSGAPEAAGNPAAVEATDTVTSEPDGTSGAPTPEDATEAPADGVTERAHE